MARELLFSLTKKDFRLDWYSGTGAGGQHRNKHQNCCRITHIETGMMETGQNHKERARNQKEAFAKLTKRVIAHYVKEEKRDRFGNPEVIRTYHEPDNRVKDHASGQEIRYTDLAKKFDELITARLREKVMKTYVD